MITDIGTIFTKTELIKEDNGRIEFNETYLNLIEVLNTMNDRYLKDNGDDTFTIVETVIPEKTPYEEIRELKGYLSSTDYCVVKCMELGTSMADTYPEILLKRTEARQRINELEALIAAESTSEES